MFDQHEQIVVARHDGRCLPRDRRSKDRIVVGITSDAFEVLRIYDLGEQLDLRTHGSGERRDVGETGDEDFLKLVHENGARDERELTAEDPRQKLSRQTAVDERGDENVGVEHDAHLARLRPPVLLYNASDIGFFHAAAPARLAARREDPLPALEPADVLPEGLAQQLAAASTFGTSHPVDLTRESRGKRDRYRPGRRHASKLTHCLTGCDVGLAIWAPDLAGYTSAASRSAARRRARREDTAGIGRGRDAFSDRWT